MTALTEASTAFPAVLEDWAEPVCWGLPVRGLHDRRWAQRGVQVVRRGMGAVDERGPDLYLLLDPEDLVWFDLGPVASRIAWLKPALLRLRVVDAHVDLTAERVAQDADGRLVEIRRRYTPRFRGALRPLLTPDARLARRWAETGADRRSALRALREDAGAERTAVATTTGRASDARERDELVEFMGRMAAEWKSPNVALEGVYEYQPGVWAHETTRIAPGVRLIGPLWIGAGVELRPGLALIGPGLAPDAIALERRPVAWADLKQPEWRLGPKLRRRPGWAIFKRGFDVAFSLAALGATLPLYPFIALAICIEDGLPVFFAHRRQTRGGREFPCLKFRTMCKDAERIKQDLAARNQADGPQFFIADDPRLLRAGRLLRKYQLDELPQFWNVLVGQMSVVGPRPSPDRENQYCPAWREARLSVRPGVTGLWQIRRTRAPETDFQEWIRYDLEYVQQQSWRLDLWIIWRTVMQMLRGG